MNIRQRFLAEIARCNHWGMLLVGQIVGTIASSDPRSKGYRDLFQKLITLRVENSALIAVLVKRGVFTADEFTAAALEEAKALNRMYEECYPFAKSTEVGIEIFDPKGAAAFMKDWPQ